MLHSMKRLNGKKSYMAIKIDLEKSYDRISWESISNILIELNFPPKIHNLINACVSFFI